MKLVKSLQVCSPGATLLASASGAGQATRRNINFAETHFRGGQWAHAILGIHIDVCNEVHLEIPGCLEGLMDS